MRSKQILITLVFLLLIPVTYADLHTNLVHYWNLNDNAASKTLSDEVGTNALLKNYNSDTTGSSTAKLGGRSMYFNKVDWANQTISDNLWSTDYTITGWFRGEATGSVIFGIDDEAYYPVVKLVWIKGTGAKRSLVLQVTTTTNGIYNGVTADTMSDDTWYFFEIRHWLANTSTSIHINRGTTYRATADYSGTARNTNLLYIGSRHYGDSRFDGYVDSLGIWTRVLSSSELDEMYNAGTGKEYPLVSGGSDVCTYSGTGNWIMTKSCNITTANRLSANAVVICASGKTCRIQSGGSII